MKKGRNTEGIAMNGVCSRKKIFPMIAALLKSCPEKKEAFMGLWSKDRRWERRVECSEKVPGG